MVTNQSSVAELVADTSPLVVLGKVGRLDLLLEGSKRLVLPLAVADEIRAGPVSDPARIALDAGRFGDPVPVDCEPPASRVSLVIPCGGSCRRTDSLLGD